MIARYAHSLWAALVVALLVGLGAQTFRLAGVKTELAQLQSTVERERSARADQRAEDERQARHTEHQLRERADAQRKEAHEKERVLLARVDTLRGELRNRPERPKTVSGVATAACTAACGTGAGLYRDDAEVALWFATRAAQHALERDTCHRQYHDAAEALKQHAERAQP